MWAKFMNLEMNKKYLIASLIYKLIVLLEIATNKFFEWLLFFYQIWYNITN